MACLMDVMFHSIECLLKIACASGDIEAAGADMGGVDNNNFIVGNAMLVINKNRNPTRANLLGRVGGARCRRGLASQETPFNR